MIYPVINGTFPLTYLQTCARHTVEGPLYIRKKTADKKGPREELSCIVSASSSTLGACYWRRAGVAYGRFRAGRHQRGLSSWKLRATEVQKVGEEGIPGGKVQEPEHEGPSTDLNVIWGRLLKASSLDQSSEIVIFDLSKIIKALHSLFYYP